MRRQTGNGLKSSMSDRKQKLRAEITNGHFLEINLVNDFVVMTPIDRHNGKTKEFFCFRCSSSPQSVLRATEPLLWDPAISRCAQHPALHCPASGKFFLHLFNSHFCLNTSPQRMSLTSLDETVVRILKGSFHLVHFSPLRYLRTTMNTMYYRYILLSVSPIKI